MRRPASRSGVGAAVRSREERRVPMRAGAGCGSGRRPAQYSEKLPWKRDELAVAHLDDAPGDLVQEVAVVRDNEDRALEVGERVLDRLARRDIEVIRRLVEDQEVRLRDDELRELEPVALAAREIADALAEVIGPKQELQQDAVRAFAADLGRRHELREDRAVVVEHILLLRAVADA